MTVELRQLRHLLAIEQHGTLGRAAAALGMTQPALSRSIQGLEHRVGTTLFVRSKSGVALTDEGRLIIRRAREVVHVADEFDREVLRERAPGAGQIAVGAGPFPGETIVPEAVARFVATHPRLRVRVVVRDWDELARRLRAREIELFVAETSTLERDQDLDVEPLAPHPVYFVARAGHPLARRTVVRTEHLFAYPMVTLSRHPPRVLQPLLEARRRTVARAGRPFPALEMSTLAGVKRILAASDAITGLPLPCMAEEIESGALVLLGREPWMNLGYGIVRLKGPAQNAATTAFCALLREAEAALVREEAKLLTGRSLSAAGASGPRRR